MRLVTVTGPSFQSNHKFFLTSFFPLSCALLSSNEVHNVGILKNSKLIPQEENSFIQSLTTSLLQYRPQIHQFFYWQKNK